MKFIFVVKFFDISSKKCVQKYFYSSTALFCEAVNCSRLEVLRANTFSWVYVRKKLFVYMILFVFFSFFFFVCLFVFFTFASNSFFLFKSTLDLRFVF